MTRIGECGLGTIGQNDQIRTNHRKLSGMILRAAFERCGRRPRFEYVEESHPIWPLCWKVETSNGKGGTR